MYNSITKLQIIKKKKIENLVNSNNYVPIAFRTKKSNSNKKKKDHDVMQGNVLVIRLNNDQNKN